MQRSNWPATRWWATTTSASPTLDTQARMCKYYYLEATLTEQETAIYNQQVDCGLKQAYLQILLEAVEDGTRHMYIYEPVPTPARFKL